MKTQMLNWWTGSMIIAISGTPYWATNAVIDRLKPESVAGGVPGWWLALSFSMWCVAIVIAPLFIRYYVRLILRTDGFFGCGPVERTGRQATPPA